MANLVLVPCKRKEPCYSKREWECDIEKHLLCAKVIRDMMRHKEFVEYVNEIKDALERARFTNPTHGVLKGDEGLRRAVTLFKESRRNRKKVILIGNGGSAAIASHMAQDFSKAAGLRAVAFNDASLLTCLANDYSFEDMFSKAIELYGDRGDTLIAISSSGNSPDILRAVKRAKALGVRVITLSGFNPRNKLSRLGDLNIHIPSSVYGVVEMSHHSILHCLCDYFMKLNNRPSPI